jgi:methylated-DNA-protein-cysteine methyltransferase-like protein
MKKPSSNPKNNSFFEKVFDVTKKIPYGRVTTYGAIAKFLGTKMSARTVGWALNSSHNLNEFIPAHRVINRKGILTGKHHFGNPNLMQQLLENEGIIVENDRVIEFNKLFWDPSVELI